MTEEEIHELAKARRRERDRQKYQDDPERREALKAYYQAYYQKQKARMAADPEYADMIHARQRRYYYKRTGGPKNKPPGKQTTLTQKQIAIITRLYTMHTRVTVISAKINTPYHKVWNYINKHFRQTEL